MHFNVVNIGRSLVLESHEAEQLNDESDPIIMVDSKDQNSNGSANVILHDDFQDEQ